ncbi:MAG: aminoglycoside phosphotransferase family protein [Clostridia bacterium]|nr:aminoglycoside phosphotransferase family protein [Clostridia bacterium]
MVIDRITPISLDKDKAVAYARLAASEYAGKKVKKCKYLGGGSFGRAVSVTYDGGQTIVVKLLCNADMLEKETHDLSLLASHCSISMPKVLFVRKADDSIPVDCYGMEKIDGRCALFSLRLLLGSRRKRAEFADKVTNSLHSLHMFKSDKFGDTLSPDCNSWIDCYKPFAEAVLSKAEEMHSIGEMPDRVMDVMRAAWAKFDTIFSEDVEEACLIHGDLNLANIMVDKGRLAGFIDPLNSMYADREYDLFQFDNFFKKKFNLRQTYMQKFGASKNCDYKCAFYGLWNEVYCYIKSGVLVGIIMNPLIDNMYARLAEL